MIESIQIKDFRCYSDLTLELGETAVMIGRNGQGKTSILEAVCVLLRLQSPRSSKTSDLIRFQQPGFFLAGEVGGERLTHAVHHGQRRIGLGPNPAKSRAEYLQQSALVTWIGNPDLELVRGGSEGRRRYLDFIGSQIHPEYHAALRSYEKALRSRNFLLKRDARPDWQAISSYHAILQKHGQLLHDVRSELVMALAPLAQHSAQGISDGTGELLTLQYLPGFHAANLGDAIEEARPEDERKRMTTVGPHRSDLQLLLHGKDAHQFASEGQQRTIVLALKLAQFHHLSALRGQAPILLIDDVFGELDPPRRNALLQNLPNEAQKLITTTHLDWLESAKLSHLQLFEVDQSKVKRIEV